MTRNRCLLSLSIVLLSTPVASAAVPKCTTGELFAGSPDYNDPMDRAKNGQRLLDVPPLGFRKVLFAGDRLVTAVGPELWYSDLSAAAPTLQRFVGRESTKGHESIPGKCSDARLNNIGGIALLPDGSIAGADMNANNVFLVTDPFGPACAVSFIAGATEPQPQLNPGQPAAVGDADGPGAQALLRGPDWVAAGEDGTIYFNDSGNGKLKKVLPNAAHTVATVTKLPEGIYYDFILLNGKLYGVANNHTSEGFLLEIDPASGKTRDILRGRSDTWLSEGSINVSGLATDGTGLITSQSGRVLYVTLDGNIESIAGNGTYFEYRDDYDPHKPHGAADLQLWSMRRNSTAGANVFLAYRDGHIYYSALGTTPYVQRIACK
jgi:hypothetical protein